MPVGRTQTDGALRFARPRNDPPVTIGDGDEDTAQGLVLLLQGADKLLGRDREHKRTHVRAFRGQRQGKVDPKIRPLASEIEVGKRWRLLADRLARDHGNPPVNLADGHISIESNEGNLSIQSNALEAAGCQCRQNRVAGEGSQSREGGQRRKPPLDISLDGAGECCCCIGKPCRRRLAIRFPGTPHGKAGYGNNGHQASKGKRQKVDIQSNAPSDHKLLRQSHNLRHP